MVDPAFVGAWQLDMSQNSGLEEWGQAMGLAPEKIEVYKNLDYIVSISLDGDTIALSVDLKGKAPNKTFSVKLGEETDYTSLVGYTCKLTLSVEDGKTVESYVYAQANKKWRVTRSVEGDVMTALATVEDVTFKSILRRV